MKILHVLANISPRFGGPARVCRELSEELVRRGVENTIFTTNLDYPKGILSVPTDGPVLENGVLIYYFPVSFRPLVFSTSMAHAIWDEMDKFDVVHIHGIYRFPQTFAGWYARKIGKPYIIRPHGSLDPYLYFQKRNKWFKRIYEYLFELKNLNCASKIHYTTIDELKLTSFLGLEEKGFVIPNGINVSRFASLPKRGFFRNKYGIDPKTPMILFLGRINFKKGLDLLIPAFSLLREKLPNALLAIAGPDNDGFGLQVHKWVNESNLEKAVIFTGMLDSEEVLTAYVDADVFVLPSYSENFGIAVIEAMACGCPVVISDKVNIWNDVSKSRGGVVVRCSVDDLLGGLEQVLNNREEALQMGLAGRDYTLKNYSWKSIAEQLYCHYLELV
jgi:glycosyltransferase involved in cell wall biosynthesis